MRDSQRKRYNACQFDCIHEYECKNGFRCEECEHEDDCNSCTKAYCRVDEW